MRETSQVIHLGSGAKRDHFTEKEISYSVKKLFEKLNTVPPRRNAPAAKTALIDFFGIAKSGKSTTTEGIERLFRRAGCQVFCPPETAEIKEVRDKSCDSLQIFQARHLTGVQNYVLNLAHNRDFHVALLSRGLIDMLYWYERMVREGKCTEEHRRPVCKVIYEFLRLDLVDAFFFFDCSPEEAMRREYADSITKKQGSNMTEKALTEARDIYREIIRKVAFKVPNLPIFTVDTTQLGIKETQEEVLRFLLPALCSRFGISSP